MPHTGSRKAYFWIEHDSGEGRRCKVSRILWRKISVFWCCSKRHDGFFWNDHLIGISPVVSRAVRYICAQWKQPQHALAEGDRTEAALGRWGGHCSGSCQLNVDPARGWLASPCFFSITVALLIVIYFLQREFLERLRNLSKFTQLESSRMGIQSQVWLIFQRTPLTHC